MPSNTSLSLLSILLSASTAVAVTTAPGPVITNGISPASSTSSGSDSFSSVASCAAPSQQFESYCCSGTLIYPAATGSPQGTYRTTDVPTGRALAVRSEPGGIGRTHSLNLLPGTELASGVTCFGSVGTLAGNDGSTTVGGGGPINTNTDSAAQTTATTTAASAGQTSMSGTDSGSTVGSTSATDGMSSTASSSTTGATSTAATGGAGREAGSVVGGLLGLLVALL